MSTLTKVQQRQMMVSLKPEVCNACGEKSSRALHFDHDHARGAHRGWLCHNCNVALGMVKDDVERLQKLIAYLEKFQRHCEAVNSLFKTERCSDGVVIVSLCVTKESLDRLRESFR